VSSPVIKVGEVMASQKQLRAMFDGMNTAQKGNFISNLKKTLNGSDNSENAQFLEECITTYNSELEAESAPELVLEAEPAPVVEPKLEAKPVIVKMLDTEPDPIVAQKSEARTKTVSEPELEPEAEPVINSETVVVPEPEPEAELGSEPDTETELVSESMVEPEVEPEAETEAGFLNAAQSDGADDNGVRESVSESDVAPAASENRIDFIAKEIYDLADNIRYNLCVIETISDLLSGKWHVESGAEASTTVNAQMFDGAAASFGTGTAVIQDIFRDGIATPVEFENTINYIETKVSELADSIRHDVSVIGAISSLLSGTGITLEKATAQADEPEPVAGDLAPVADGLAPVTKDTATSDSGENKIDDAMKEFFEISESV